MDESVFRKDWAGTGRRLAAGEEVAAAPQPGAPSTQTTGPPCGVLGGCCQLPLGSRLTDTLGLCGGDNLIWGQEPTWQAPGAGLRLGSCWGAPSQSLAAPPPSAWPPHTPHTRGQAFSL